MILRFFFTVCLLLAPLTGPCAFAQAPQSVAGEDEAPVPVPEPSERALQYYTSGNVLWVMDQVWSLLIPVLFLFSGFSARIRSWAQRLGRKWFFVIGLYVVIFSAINFVIDIPMTYYEGFVREHAYGLSNQTIGKW